MVFGKRYLEGNTSKTSVFSKYENARAIHNFGQVGRFTILGRFDGGEGLADTAREVQS